MTRSLLKLMSLLLMVFAVLSLAACTLPEFKSSNPALVGFTEGCEDKPQPCWYGIVPWYMTVAEAEIIWETESSPPDETLSVSLFPNIPALYNSDCTGTAISTFEEGDIDYISIRCENLRLGEVVFTLGSPHSIPMDFFEHGRSSIFYPYLELSLDNDQPLTAITPFLKVHEIIMPIHWGSTRVDPCWYWLGFTSKERYLASELKSTGECY